MGWNADRPVCGAEARQQTFALELLSSLARSPVMPCFVAQRGTFRRLRLAIRGRLSQRAIIQMDPVKPRVALLAADPPDTPEKTHHVPVRTADRSILSSGPQ